MRLALLQHVPFEGPGLILAAADSSRVTFDRRKLWAGDPVPAPGEHDGVVVLGGPMGVADTSSHPYLPSVIELLSAAARSNQPVLGICLGAQLLARALGAAVLEGGSAEEVGIGKIMLTAEGHSDPVLSASGSEPSVFHWHRDTFDLPSGAVHLARSTACRHQAFRWGNRAYGLQFHAELDPPLYRSMAAHLPNGVGLGEMDLRRLMSTGSPILRRFFEKACETRNSKPRRST